MLATLRKYALWIYHIYSFPVYAGVLVIRNYARNRNKGIEHYQVNISFWLIMSNAFFFCLLLPYWYPEFKDFQAMDDSEDSLLHLLIGKAGMEAFWYAACSKYISVTAFYDSLPDTTRKPLIWVGTILLFVVCTFSVVGLIQYLP